MKVLVIGGGGREHALCWKIRQSPLVTAVACAPGNAGTAEIAENVDLSADEPEAVIKWCHRERIGLVVIGPEVPLVAGLADKLRAADVVVFGPGARGAQLEGSKTFAKQMMQRYIVPTGKARSFDDFDSARTYIEGQENFPLVLKADGLAAGKGVVLPETMEDAVEAAHEIMVERRFGDAGEKLLVEECLRGQELSVFAITDGRTIAMLDCAQDHKRIGDGDSGPNTGGMGTFSPTPVATDDVLAKVTSEVLVRIVHALARERIEFRGVLFAGLMATRGGPRVLEYNTRFGDPETQVLMARMRGDIVPLLLGAANGNLSDVPPLEWDERAAVCVVMASGGYPASSSKGDVITGLDEVAEMEDVVVFHAGTARVGGDIVTAGGRVLGVTALGADIDAARALAYAAVEKIQFEGRQFRTDIGLSAAGS